MTRTVEHRTYRRSECAVFRKTNEHFGGLSNMAGGYPLRVNGVRILTSEALYQACRFPHMPDVQRLIIDQSSPMTAKMKSKPYRKQSRPDWDSVNVKVMRWSLRVKLAQNWRKFGDLLLETGNRPIVEESVKDDFWGARPTDDETLVGANVLGRLLMELREQLRTDPTPLLQVEPPPLSSFVLYTKPIDAIIAEVSARELIERPSKSPAAAGTPVSNADRSLWELGDEVAATPKPVESPQPEPVAKAEWSASVIPKECKRLAEVDFPIAVVSKHARAEKDSRIAHIPRLHVWPAARPGGACRTILLASLLPDPCDQHCPRTFVDSARAILQRFSEVGPSAKDVQTRLLVFVGELSNWDIAHTKSVLRAAQDLVKAAHGEAPLVVDPFAGGGMIPLEALRLGCDAVSSDLNPVACLIDQVVLNDMPRYRDEMLETLEGLAAKVKARTEADLRSLYPRDTDGLEPVAYLWARTVTCEQPNCGCEIPLMRSFWLAQKAGRRRALRVKAASGREGPALQFEIFEPQRDEDIQGATVARANATCIACKRTLVAERVRAQLRQQRGGACVQFGEGTPRRRTGGARLLAVASLNSDSTERRYRLPNDRDYEVVAEAQRRVEALHGATEDGVRSFPDEATPVGGGRGAGRAFSVHAYGMTVWADLFTARQLVAIRSLCRSIHELVPEHLRALVALLISKVIDMNNSLTEWRATGERPAHMLSRWALPMKWDFPEAVPISEASGSLGTALARTMHLLRVFNITRPASSVNQADAAIQLLPDDSVSMWFTDPPYYDAIPYSDLSDFFFVWLKRVLPGHPLLRDPFDAANQLTPKSREAVQDEQRIDEKGAVKDKQFFERKMREAFKTGRRVLRDDGIGCVVFAHKTTEGWEALLSGIVAAGWVITNSWPLATEMSSRLRARDSAALATSIHLICRPRSDDASTGDWGEVIRELPKRIAEWMDRLGDEGIRGADLVFACIGPALELFSKHARVETPDGEEVGLAANEKARGEPARRGFLSYVWEFAGRTALNQVLGAAESRARNGAAGALEEDARLTALFLWTLQATEAAANGKAAKKAAEAEDDEADDADEGDDDGEETGAKKGKKKAGLSLIYDVARRFAQPLGIHLDVWEGRIIETAKGVVRLLPVGERAKQLFGEDGASAIVRRFDSAKKPDPQGMLDFMAEQRAAAVPEVKGRGRKRKDGTEPSPESLRAKREATTLDRVHAAMLLQDSGATNALRALLEAEVERGPDFLRLANALSALYPRDSEEKRLLDAMLLAVPR